MELLSISSDVISSTPDADDGSSQELIRSTPDQDQLQVKSYWLSIVNDY